MKMPWYKIVWSYFNEIVLETSGSDINGELYLSLNKGQFQLCTRNAIYSYGNRYDNFFDTFALLNLDKPEVKNVLILGMGLGSIPYMLENSFQKTFDFTCVEPDEQIIQWAHTYILNDLKSFVEVIQTDADTFVSMTEYTYDMICVDVFTDTVVPDEILHPDFMESLKHLLTPSGFILFNHLAMYEKEKERALSYYECIFKKTFVNATYLKLKSNFMLLSDQGRQLKKASANLFMNGSLL